MQKRIMNVNELAETLNIGIQLAYKLARSNDFYPAFRVGRKICIDVDSFEQWINEKTTKRIAAN